MLKVQFGCGSNILDGWENHDSDIDIRHPLPYDSCTVSYVFCEHLIEHVTHQEAFKFLEECHRILASRGILRIAFPDVRKIWLFPNADYENWVRAKFCTDPIRNILFNHGHQALWTVDIMRPILDVIGFEWCTVQQVGKSTYKELVGIEGHGKQIGDEFNIQETSVMEARKR